jgi:aspartate/methionine/tyrosine aminotransferase
VSDYAATSGVVNTGPMGTPDGLFAALPSRAARPLPPDLLARAARPIGPTVGLDPGPDERLLEVFARAQDPQDPHELCDLFIGRVEAELGQHATRPELAAAWRTQPLRRTVDADEVLSGRHTVRFVKELFNFYFRDDLYGALRSQADVILSGGAVDEERWGLPVTLKACISYALDRDWYGYSDSRGRDSARDAVARYESARVDGASYDRRNVALTMGGTFGVATLTDFLTLERPHATEPALCAVPNYPPLVEAIARRTPVQLVPVPCLDGHSSLQPLIDALTPQTPMVMLQTVANPTGAGVPEHELTRLIEAAGPSTMILLDECHEWLGPTEPPGMARTADHVIRLNSLSKSWSTPGLKLGWFMASAALIDAYYEYASTTFGGPPSFFYTIMEVFARLERWQLEDLEVLGPEQVAEFGQAYALTLPHLQAAYDSYRTERQDRRVGLTTLRDAAVGMLDESGSGLVLPRHSINVAIDVGTSGVSDSYVAFRSLLQRTGVSVFPGLLTFCMSGAFVRVTTSRQWSHLEDGLVRLRSGLTA